MSDEDERLRGSSAPTAEVCCSCAQCSFAVFNNRLFITKQREQQQHHHHQVQVQMRVQEQEQQDRRRQRRRRRGAIGRRRKIVTITNESQAKSIHKPRYSLHKMGNKTTQLLVAFLCLIASTGISLAGAQQAASPLPTVIVRGFLNYRTTVDGTVLLFTPDAGGSGTTSSISISSSLAPTISATQPLVQQQTSDNVNLIEPTVRQHPMMASTASLPGSRFEPLAGNNQPAPLSSDNGWRPVQPTPPLQTAFRPQPSQTLDTISGSSPSPGGELGGSKSTPSVQSEDVVAPAEQQVAAGGSQSQEAPTAVAARSTPRAKRPTLGFTGQHVRGGIHGGSSRAPSSEMTLQSTQSSSPRSNSINGIRRPGLHTGGSPSTSGASASEQPPTTVPNSQSSFQGRLTSASAKLRNRFKQRPPVSGANPALGQQQQQQQANESQPSVEEQPGAVATSTAQSTTSTSSSSSTTTSNGELVAASTATSPTVGSDEVLAVAIEPIASNEQATGGGGSKKPDSRSGEQSPSAISDFQEPQLITGGLSAGAELPSGQLGFDPFLQGDQPQPPSQQQAESSEHRPSHLSRESGQQRRNNDRLNGWLDQHHNKFVPRPQKQQQHHPEQSPGHLSHQLAANLNSLAPSFAANLGAGAKPVVPTSVLQQSPTAASQAPEGSKPSVGSPGVEGGEDGEPVAAAAAEGNEHQEKPSGNSTEMEQLQTITKTYSTIMTSSRTRLVPLHVKSSTGVHTILESYVITKVLTAYQTMPMGEFVLPETQSTRAPFEMFNEPSPMIDPHQRQTSGEQPIMAPSNFAPAQEQQIQQEQPISLETSKSPTDWLHDFNNPLTSNQPQPPAQQQMQNNLAALLEQQAQEANGLAGLQSLSGEPLDGLASSLDPAALLADAGNINIPDLNNPLVLAAAIQNPQLAAVILAAQQLQLKQRAAQKQHAAGSPVQLQPSYSTTYSTQVKPSTYTARDTMYTTRLVSFKDGRTVRTRTVSEPGQVIEQVLTTTVTETIPVTLTIRPTGALMLTATAPPGAGLAAAGPSASSQATLNNALIATQLAQLLARRQQQVAQPFQQQSSQLAALQQLLGNSNQQQQQQLQLQQRQQAAAKQFQPNFQQLLQSIQQQQQQQQQSQSTSPSTSGAAASNGNNNNRQQVDKLEPTPANNVATMPMQPPTPPLQHLPTQPFVTTLTNLQVKTYTVHNAFKTIYRTITSTQLITSTILPAALASPVRSTQLAGG